MQPTEFRLRSSPSTMPRDRGVGCFFSGGVDSFYSALAHRSELTHLILVHGLDISLDNRNLWSKTVDGTSAAAVELGIPIIQVRTNLREVMRRFGPDWYLHGHGPFLAHIALMLAPILREVVIPATVSDEQLHPYSTHPELDPLWSSSAVTIRHHGVVRRADKVREIARSDTAMRHLRVCWWNLSTSYNCARCEKCLRTMIALYAVDALPSCATFPDRIPLTALRFVKIDQGGDSGVSFAEENATVLREAGKDDSDVARALRGAMTRGPVGRMIADTWFWMRFARDAIGHLTRSAADKALARRPDTVDPAVAHGSARLNRAQSGDADMVG